MGAGRKIFGYYPTTPEWLPIRVDSAGRVLIDPSLLFENPPTEDETKKGPSSQWAYDHWKDPNAHHNRQHALSSSDDHTGEITDAQHGERTKSDAHAHSDLSGIGASDHHAKYTDAEAIAAAKTDSTLLNFTQGARVYNSTAQTIPTGTWTALAFDSERYDTDTIHSTTTYNTRLTAKTAGKYVINGNAGFVNNMTGLRALGIRLNGSTYIGFNTVVVVATYNHYSMVTTIYDLGVNDYVEFVVFQGSGGDLDMVCVGNYSPEFMMQKIG